MMRLSCVAFLRLVFVCIAAADDRAAGPSAAADSPRGDVAAAKATPPAKDAAGQPASRSGASQRQGGTAKAAAAPPRPADKKSASPAATSLLHRAKLLEKNGKRENALELYRRVQKEFPDSPQARDAGQRVRELEPAGDR